MTKYIIGGTLPVQTFSARSGNPVLLTLPHVNSYQQKQNRKFGSEAASMIRMPEGFSLVSFDFASQESVIFGLLGDAYNKAELSCESSIANNNGDKSQKTDIHSLRAQRFNISRNAAKTCTYLVQFGGGAEGLAKKLYQSSQEYSLPQARQIAKAFIKGVKGTKPRGAKLFADGSDSACFNYISEWITQPCPRLPLTNRAISRAARANVTGSDFSLSRGNFLIQSTGADMLHWMVYHSQLFIEESEINANFLLSVHDYLGWQVETKHAELFARKLLLLHKACWQLLISNLGLNPSAYSNSILFPESVEIDQCFRKTPQTPTQTPTSLLDEIPAGYSVTARQLNL